MLWWHVIKEKDDFGEEDGEDFDGDDDDDDDDVKSQYPFFFDNICIEKNYSFFQTTSTTRAKKCHPFESVLKTWAKTTRLMIMLVVMIIMMMVLLMTTMIWWLWRCWWSRTCYFPSDISPRGMTISPRKDHFPRDGHFPRTYCVENKWPNSYSVRLRVEWSGFETWLGHCAMLLGKK